MSIFNVISTTEVTEKINTAITFVDSYNIAHAFSLSPVASQDSRMARMQTSCCIGNQSTLAD